MLEFLNLDCFSIINSFLNWGLAIYYNRKFISKKKIVDQYKKSAYK